MWAWIAGTRLGRAVAAAGAVLLIVGAVLLRAFNAGKSAERAEAKAKALKTRERMQDANADARRGDVRDRLRDGDF
jgi:hypothetical protein